MLDECRDLMCVDGCLVIPTHDAEGFAGLVSLFHEGKEPDAAMRRALKLMAIYASEKAKDLAGIEGEQTGANGNCPLTPRQREVLAFSALGKTDWEVAQILGISEKTANFHCERAKEQLGVATRAQAIAIAIHRGWVSL
jgi:DNA-binding CsgD family transcriptional regulator